jgi:NTE family protein
MSGAMLGFLKEKEKIKFEVISTAGVGGLVGLLFVAPKNGDPKKALEGLCDLFVSDLLYMLFPVNFKAFSKYGPFSEQLYELREKIPKLSVKPQEAGVARFVNDWIDLVFTALTPTTPSFRRPALMSRVYATDHLIDFDELKTSAIKFYLTAFNLSKKELEIFDNASLDVDRYHAAQALPPLLAPERINGQVYTTGATHDPTGLQAIWLKHRDLDAIITLDLMSSAIWRPPTNIWDAFQLMLMSPVMALQALMFSVYARTDQLSENLSKPARSALKPQLPKLYRIPLIAGNPGIKETDYPAMLKWTHSNAVALQDIGEEAATKFAEVWKTGGNELEKYRFHHHVPELVKKDSSLNALDELYRWVWRPPGSGSQSGQPSEAPSPRPSGGASGKKPDRSGKKKAD